MLDSNVSTELVMVVFELLQQSSMQSWYQLTMKQLFMGLDGRIQDLVLLHVNSKRHRPACVSTQSDQRHCFSLSWMCNVLACCTQSFNNLASLRSWAGLIEFYMAATSEDRFSRGAIKVFHGGIKCTESKFKKSLQFDSLIYPTFRDDLPDSYWFRILKNPLDSY